MILIALFDAFFLTHLTTAGSRRLVWDCISRLFHSSRWVRVAYEFQLASLN